MAISTQDPVLTWRRVANALHSFSPAVQLLAQGLKRYLIQQGGNPDLLMVPFSALGSSETVIAAEACTLYAIFAKKQTATATYTKLTNHATTSSDTAADIVALMSGIKSFAILYPNGLALSAGATMQGNTTADGGADSGANGAEGFCLIGAA